jgi:capsular polysaccharide biosynthesis protein
MIRFRPLISRIVGRLFKTAVVARASEILEISPAKAYPPVPATKLDDEEPRVIAAVGAVGVDKALARLNNPTTQGRTRAFLVHDVLIADGAVMTATARECFQDRRRRMVLATAPKAIPDGMLCTSHVGERYFSHWLVDGLTHELLARDLGMTPLVLARTPWLHEKEYRELLEIHAQVVDTVRVERLWLLEDWELNAHRAERLEQLRTTLRSKIGRGGPERVFISRGQTGVGRSLKNEAEVRRALEDRSFVVIEPEKMSVAAIASTLASARIVVAVEGSAIGHAIIALPRGAGILAMQPPKRFNAMWKTFSDALGFHFGCTVGDDVDGDSFTQPVGRLLRTLDLLEVACAGPILADA